MDPYGRCVTSRLPWEIVETFPSTDAALINSWRAALDEARSVPELVRASTGLALSLYWAHQEGLVPDFAANLREREELTGSARELAGSSGDADCVATAILGELYALWGPDHLRGRDSLIGELAALGPSVTDPELAMRTAEWRVLQAFHSGETECAREMVHRFASDPVIGRMALFDRRVQLWRANLAMIDGRIDEALRINTEAVSATADTAGSPLSYQNVAITVAIERYLRRGLDDAVESVRSIRASSPRVRANWDSGLAFTLAETGRLEEAEVLFEALATDRFSPVPRDLNWLVTLHLLGLVALRLRDTRRMVVLAELLDPYAGLEALHGAGYASYGPVGRVVGVLAAGVGDHDRARAVFDEVLDRCTPGPWRSLALLDRAEALAGVDPLSALADATAAKRELAELDMGGWADAAANLVVELSGVVPVRPTVLRTSSGYELRHELGVATASGKGADHLIGLLCSAGQMFDVVELEGILVTGSDRPGQRSTGGGQPQRYRARSSMAESTLDATASKQYRRRLAELTGRDGPLSAEELTEVDFLKRELVGASFLKAVSVEDERARVRVTQAIRRCVGEVTRQAPALGAHLTETISTGRRCMYAPADGVSWELLAAPGGKVPAGS